ncbi:hypothetical protein SLEP1_g15231 [Rubroshorea leprosula]|uniref:Uncharacterized protein n=1 Tax=Rubroshorea leprosula TaxID=152421 RepID=A0AAV5IYE3_9ROSI|nr:hypothetical protein SLEP1_g15231 [Rubroshorea leprosula]
MKLHVSMTGINRVIIPNATAAAVVRSRIPGRTLFLLLLVVAIVFSSLFVRTAFLVLESAASCSSPIDCIGWRLMGQADTSQEKKEYDGIHCL